MEEYGCRGRSRSLQHTDHPFTTQDYRNCGFVWYTPELSLKERWDRADARRSHLLEILYDKSSLPESLVQEWIALVIERDKLVKEKFAQSNQTNIKSEYLDGLRKFLTDMPNLDQSTGEQEIKCALLDLEAKVKDYCQSHNLRGNYRVCESLPPRAGSGSTGHASGLPPTATQAFMQAPSPSRSRRTVIPRAPAHLSRPPTPSPQPHLLLSRPPTPPVEATPTSNPPPQQPASPLMPLPPAAPPPPHCTGEPCGPVLTLPPDVPSASGPTLPSDSQSSAPLPTMISPSSLPHTPPPPPPPPPCLPTPTLRFPPMSSPYQCSSALGTAQFLGTAQLLQTEESRRECPLDKEMDGPQEPIPKDLLEEIVSVGQRNLRRTPLGALRTPRLVLGNKDLLHQALMNKFRTLHSTPIHGDSSAEGSYEWSGVNCTLNFEDPDITKGDMISPVPSDMLDASRRSTAI